MYPLIPASAEVFTLAKLFFSTYLFVFVIGEF